MAKTPLILVAVGMSILGTAAASAQSAATEVGARLVDIGGGRKVYLTCRGAGTPTVVLIAGLKASADDWNSAGNAAPTVFSGVPM